MVVRNNQNSYVQRTRNFIRQDKIKYFACGLVAAYAIKKIAETDAAHEFAVNATAELLNLKDSLEETVENIREDAEDIHTEAQEKQQVEIFGPEDLEDLEFDDEELDDDE